jgi:hypothetical protein
MEFKKMKITIVGTALIVATMIAAVILIRYLDQKNRSQKTATFTLKQPFGHGRRKGLPCAPSLAFDGGGG